MLSNLISTNKNGHKKKSQFTASFQSILESMTMAKYQHLPSQSQTKSSGKYASKVRVNKFGPDKQHSLIPDALELRCIVLQECMLSA